jgi:hypothetical protein
MSKEIISDVWKLETPNEELACEEINFLYQQATEKKSTRARNILKKCFDSDWKTIKERMETEGSTCYIWYMDVVRVFMELERSRKL